jgi:hypothetical protein
VVGLVSGHGISRVPCPQGRATIGLKTADLPNGTPGVFDGAASGTQPAASRTRAAHTHPIDIIGGRRKILYSYRTRKRRRLLISCSLPARVRDGPNEKRDLPNGTPGVFDGAASEAQPAASRTRAAHTPPIDLIGGRREILYSYRTRKRRRLLISCSLPARVRDGPNKKGGLAQWDARRLRRCRLGGPACRLENPRGAHSPNRHNRRTPLNPV